MTNTLPITVLAQLDEMTVFQTAALPLDTYPDSEPSQQMRRIGQPSYGALNLGLHVNDNAAQVLNNRMRLLSAINSQLATQQRAPIKNVYWVNQIHGKQIYEVDANALMMRPMDADAMVSQQSGLGLAIMTADCVPIVLHQPATGQIAAIHAGWQGLACGVIKATAARFESSAPIESWIGVCISQENYEVGRQVYDQLLAGCRANQSLTQFCLNHFNQRYRTASASEFDAQVELDSTIELINSHETVDKMSNTATVSTDKVKLNLPKLAADQLTAVGITVNTDIPIACSYADARYYSYRRQTHLQQPATGRMALIIVRHSSIAPLPRA